MTIKDLDTETLTLLSKLSDIWFVKNCSTWLTQFMDKYCQECQLRELCYLLDCYDAEIRAELIKRGEFNHDYLSQ